MTVKLIMICIVFILLILLVTAVAYLYGRTSAYREMMEEDLDAAYGTLQERLDKLKSQRHGI